MSSTQYNPNTPLPDDKLAASQTDFLNNFSDLYNAFRVNHVALDGGATAGNHTKIELLEQPKGFQTNIGEISVYTKDVEGQTDQIFLKYENGQEFQFTNYQIYKPVDVAWKISYFTFLPGKILVYFGTFKPSKYPPTGFGDPAITLEPNIAKNIMSFNICSVGSTPNVTPSVSLINNLDPSIINAIGFVKFTLATSLDYQYLILANV